MNTQKREKLDAMNALLRYYEYDVPLAEGLYNDCPFCELYLSWACWYPGTECACCPWKDVFGMKYACEQWHKKWYGFADIYKDARLEVKYFCEYWNDKDRFLYAASIKHTKQNRHPDFVQARIAMLQMWIVETISGE